MNLRDASRFFDKALCADAYNPSSTFYGQLDLYDDSKRDGVTVERRILSVSADVIIPLRRTIVIEGIVWLVGDRNIDTFMGNVIRNKYVIHQVQDLGMLRTPKQMLSTGGLSTYTSVVWVKDSKEIETSSRLYSFMNAYFATGEPVTAGQILTLGIDNYRMRNVFKSAAGVVIGECSLIPSGSVELGDYTSTAGRVYNATTDTYSSLPTVVSSLFERFQDSYIFESAAAPKYVNGDMLAIVQQSEVPSPQVGDSLVRTSGNWKVISFSDDLKGSWELQVRRA